MKPLKPMKVNYLALRVIRELSGASQSGVAGAVGMERANYAHIEAGRRPGTAEQIVKIARALRVPVGAIAVMGAEVLVDAEAVA
jgi:transcriptional regulator with XRE-family HTH domain